jgi:hypothetical protein
METGIIILLFTVFFTAYIIIAYFLFRWIFAVKRQMWNQKEQLLLLSKIAEKLEVDPKYIEDMKQRMQMSDEFLK